MSSGKQQVTAKGIPAPPPVLSHAIISNGIVFCSGQTGKKPDGTYVEGDITERTRQIFRNLEAVLKEAGSSLDKIVKVNVFLTDISNMPAVNQVYAECLKDNPKPARSCVAVHQLPDHTDVEIECSAHL